MKTELTVYEIEILHKVLPAVSFTDHKRLQAALKEAIREKNEAITSSNAMVHPDLHEKTLEYEGIEHINHYLLDNGFYAQREGGIYFITEKGKDLHREGSLQQYNEWREKRSVEYKNDIFLISTRGYLDRDQDQIVHNAQKNTEADKIKKYLFYPVVIIILLLLTVGYAHHNGYDKNFPALKNWLDK